MRLSPEARRRLAGEYVLGTLRGGARQWFARYLGASAQGRAEVAWWQERLDGLSRRQVPAPVAPAPAVWDRIARLTVAAPAAGTPMAAPASPTLPHVVPVAAPGAVAPTAGAGRVAANDPRFVPRARLRAWQAATGLAAAASLALAGVLALRPPQVVTRTRVVTAPAPPTPVVRPWLAMLNAPAAPAAPAATGKPAEAGPRWVVILSETDAHQPTAPGRLRIRADGPGYQLPPGRALELWVIGPAGPESLGVIPATGSATLALPAGRRLPANPTLAVSVEPSGGSPSGSPTGPVILTAPAVQAF